MTARRRSERPRGRKRVLETERDSVGRPALSAELDSLDRPASERAPEPDDVDAPPPVLGTWRRLYALLVVELAVLVAAFVALGRWAS